jgi:ribosome-binding factor A
MHSRRTQKAAAAIREVVSMAILTEMNDPRVQDVTVTQVEVAPDMRQAKVHVSIRGSETKQRLCLQGLRGAAGYLQAKLASRIETRYTPRLEFVLDLGVKKSIEMAQILGRVLPPKPAEDSTEAPADHDDARNRQHDDEDSDDESSEEEHAADADEE